MSLWSADSKNNRAGDVIATASIVKLLLAVLAVLCVVTCNTLWGNLSGVRNSLRMATVVVAAVCILLLWVKVRISRAVAGWAIVWVLFVVTSYTAIGISAGDFGGKSGLFFFGLLAFAPVLFMLLRATGLLGWLVGPYIAVMAFLAASSLVIWLIGPILGLVQPNCAIENTWNGVHDLVLYTPGYWNLLYTPQASGDYSLIPGIVRNTSIFTEAPMFSFALCVALLLEVFGSRKTQPLMIALLAVAIVSTSSTTGIVIATCTVLGKWCLGVVEHGRLKPLRAILVVALAVVAILFLRSVLSLKMGGSSVSIRLDDFSAGLQAWSDNYLFGNGLGSGDAVEAYMSSWRSYNVGFSNSLMDVLSRGGLAFLLPHLVAFAGFFKGREPRFAAFALIYIAMWVFTIVTFLPLNALVLSYGVFRLLIPFDKASPDDDRAAKVAGLI